MWKIIWFGGFEFETRYLGLKCTNLTSLLPVLYPGCRRPLSHLLFVGQLCWCSQAEQWCGLISRAGRARGRCYRAPRRALNLPRATLAETRSHLSIGNLPSEQVLSVSLAIPSPTRHTGPGCYQMPAFSQITRAFRVKSQESR